MNSAVVATAGRDLGCAVLTQRQAPPYDFEPSIFHRKRCKEALLVAR
jgi:hypothetical protein